MCVASNKEVGRRSEMVACINHHLCSCDEERKWIMKPGSILATILKGKVLAAIFVSTVAVGGATAAFASTPAGQTFVHQMTAASTTTPTASTDHQGKDE